MEKIEDIIGFLKTTPVRISVFGEFSAGKSTFINALIGEDILSVAVEPTTAVPTHIQYAREFNIQIKLKNGTLLHLFENEFPFWARFVGRESILNTLQKQKGLIVNFLRQWTKEGEKAAEVSHTVIEIPLPWLQKGIELVDTPGTNNEFTRHHGFTDLVARKTDIAILLMDARQGGGKATEYKTLNEIDRLVSSSLIVINKMDTKEPEERQEIIDYVKKEGLPLNWHSPVHPLVLGTSSKVRLDKALAEKEFLLLAEFDKLIHLIEQRALNQRGEILLRRLGNPEKQLFEKARRYETDDKKNMACTIYYQLLDILEAAGLDPTMTKEAIHRCEESLWQQVKKLDAGNQKINQGMALLAEKPDEALLILKEAAKELTAINLDDRELAEKIAVLEKRIRIRDTARKTVEEQLKEAERLFCEKRYIKSVAALTETAGLLEQTEYPPNRKKNILDRIAAYLKKRSEWTQDKMVALVKQAELYLAGHRFPEASAMIPLIKRLLPYLPDSTSCEKLINKIGTLNQRFTLWCEKSEEINEIILKMIKIPLTPTHSILPVVSVLNALKNDFQDISPVQAVNETLFISSNAPFLTVDEILHVLTFLEKYTWPQVKGKERRSHLIKTAIHRRHKLSFIEFDALTANKNISYYQKYADHPQAGRYIQNLIEYTPSFLTLPFTINRVRRVLNLYQNASPDIKDTVEKKQKLLKKKADQRYLYLILLITSLLTGGVVTIKHIAAHKTLLNILNIQSNQTLSADIKKINLAFEFLSDNYLPGRMKLQLAGDRLINPLAAGLDHLSSAMNDAKISALTLACLKYGRIMAAFQSALKIEEAWFSSQVFEKIAANVPDDKLLKVLITLIETSDDPVKLVLKLADNSPPALKQKILKQSLRQLIEKERLGHALMILNASGSNLSDYNQWIENLAMEYLEKNPGNGNWQRLLNQLNPNTVPARGIIFKKIINLYLRGEILSNWEERLEWERLDDGMENLSDHIRQMVFACVNKEKLDKAVDLTLLLLKLDSIKFAQRDVSRWLKAIATLQYERGDMEGFKKTNDLASHYTTP